MKNLDQKTVDDFGREWSLFNQSALPPEESMDIFNSYFKIFPWHLLPDGAEGFDLGCGSGRWAKLVAPRVSKLHCIDPSQAIEVAKQNLNKLNNCHFYQASVDEIPLADNSMDFGYSLGVLHHIPNTQLALKSCVQKLKIGAPFLVYLYYAFDQRPWWFKMLWKISNFLRLIISRLPYFLKTILSQFIALTVYLPLAKFALFAEKLGMNVKNFPLSDYRKRSFYTLRTDALDRFATRLEHRFTKDQIASMMQKAGLEKITFSNEMPFWCAVGFRKN